MRRHVALFILLSLAGSTLQTQAADGHSTPHRGAERRTTITQPEPGDVTGSPDLEHELRLWGSGPLFSIPAGTKEGIVGTFDETRAAVKPSSNQYSFFFERSGDCVSVYPDGCSIETAGGLTVTTTVTEQTVDSPLKDAHDGMLLTIRTTVAWNEQVDRCGRLLCDPEMDYSYAFHKVSIVGNHQARISDVNLPSGRVDVAGCSPGLTVDITPSRVAVPAGESCGRVRTTVSDRGMAQVFTPKHNIVQIPFAAARCTALTASQPTTCRSARRY